MRRFTLLFALALFVLALGSAAAYAAAAGSTSSPPTKADALEAATQYIQLRANSALEGGNPYALEAAFSTSQGVTEAYIAKGFRVFHEQMGDFPTSNKVVIQDASVELKGGLRAVVQVTAQIMTGFSPNSQRSCDEGVVITHTIDLNVSPDGTYSVVSDAYPAEGTTAYLTAARAPDGLVEAARTTEQSEVDASIAAQALSAAVQGPATAVVVSPAAGVTPNYIDKITYDRVAAVAYAHDWWNSRNSYYNNYGQDDCANFVSQCTFTGGMGKFGVDSNPESHQWWFHHSTMTQSTSWTWCPTQVDAWRWQQPNKSPARYVVTLATSKPSGYSKGDVAWKINGGTESHALICTGFSGSTPLFSCHSSNHWNDPLSTWAGTNEYGVVADMWTIN